MNKKELSNTFAENDQNIPDFYGTMSVASIDRNICLIKAPRDLALYWRSQKSNNVVGHLYNFKNTKNEDIFKIETLAQSESQLSCHEYTLNKLSGKPYRLYLFNVSKKKNDFDSDVELYDDKLGEYSNSSYNFLVQGNICEIKTVRPIFNTAYKNMMKKRLSNVTENVHKTQLRDKTYGTNVVENISTDDLETYPLNNSSLYAFKYFSPFNDSITSERAFSNSKHHNVFNQLKLSEDQAKEAMFKLFEEKGDRPLKFKDFQASVRVPHTTLKSILEKIAEPVFKEGKRALWQLKKEYRVSQ